MPSDSETTVLRLRSSHDEAGNVRTFIFDTGGLSWIAGQSQGYVLPQVGGTEEENEHWFTIASAPSENEIHISTRVSQSRYKQTLNAMKPGDEVRTYGLDGDFTWEEDSPEPVVLVAGGIGVTPYRSILVERSAVGKKLNATLLYFNRTDDIPFLEELKSLADKHSEFSLLPVVGQEISADNILHLVPEAKGQMLFLSGPEPMVEVVGADLKAKGIEVKQDWFPGYDEKTY